MLHQTPASLPTLRLTSTSQENNGLGVSLREEDKVLPPVPDEKCGAKGFARPCEGRELLFCCSGPDGSGRKTCSSVPLKNLPLSAVLLPSYSANWDQKLQPGADQAHAERRNALRKYKLEEGAPPPVQRDCGAFPELPCLRPSATSTLRGWADCWLLRAQAQAVQALWLLVQVSGALLSHRGARPGWAEGPGPR